jgi:hypothetical protein
MADRYGAGWIKERKEMNNTYDFIVISSFIILAVIGFGWRAIASHVDLFADKIPPIPRRVLMLLVPPLMALLSVMLLIPLGRAYQVNSSWGFGLKLMVVQFYFVPSFLFIAAGTALAPSSKKAVCMGLGYFALLAWLIHTLVFYLAGAFTAWQFIHASIPTILAIKFVRDSIKDDDASVEGEIMHPVAEA